MHNFWAVEALNFAFFSTDFWQSLKQIQLPLPAPPPCTLLTGAGAAAVHDLVFNGVCFEAGFPFCGKGFMAAFYGHFQIQTHTERDSDTHTHTDLHISYFVIFGYHLFKVWFALWQLLSYFRAAARGVCVICDLLTSKMHYVSSRCMCVCLWSSKLTLLGKLSNRSKWINKSTHLNWVSAEIIVIQQQDTHYRECITNCRQYLLRFVQIKFLFKCLMCKV